MRPLLCFIILIFTFNNIFAQCPTPNSLNTTNVTYYNALANWNPVNGVNRYKIQYRIFGTSSWSNLSNIDSLQISRTLPQLQQGTTYEWHIKAFCDSTSQNGSAWSYTDTFTTNVFVPAQFNPVITSTISSYICNTAVDLRLLVSQQANEPDIGETTLETNGGYFDISNLNSGDTVGFASIINATQNIYTTLISGFIIGQNFAFINSYDTNNNLVGLFNIENTATGIKVSSTSPNDGNNYTNGMISEVFFKGIYITPNYTGPLYITAEIESELQDQVTYIDTVQIQCINTIEENYISKEIIHVVDLSGRKTKEKKNTPLFYIYDDGTVEKRITID